MQIDITTATIGTMLAVAGVVVAAAVKLSISAKDIEKTALIVNSMALVQAADRVRIDSHSDQITEWHKVAIERAKQLAEHDQRISALERELESARRERNEIVNRISLIDGRLGSRPPSQGG